MSGKLGSKDFGVLTVDGYDFLATKPQGFTFKITAGMNRSDGLGDTIQTQLPSGLATLTITQSGAFFDDNTTYTHALLSPANSGQTQRNLVAAYAGNTIGKPCLMASGVYAQEYNVLGNVGNLTKANVSYQVSGTIDRGPVLNDLSAKTADWNTKTNGSSVDYTLDTAQQVIPISTASKAATCVVTTSVAHGFTTGQVVLIASNTLSGPAINGEQTVTVTGTTTFTMPVNTSGSTGAGTGGTIVRSSTVNGGVGYQVITASSGFTNFVGKIRHSTDDSSYVDLITFTDSVTAPSTQRSTVAGTINRYLSFNGDVTGSGSITVFVGFARN